MVTIAQGVLQRAGDRLPWRRFGEAIGGIVAIGADT
jgi:hypothetical protein